MKIAKYWAKEIGVAENPNGDIYRLVCWSGSSASQVEAKSNAVEKLATWSKRFTNGQPIADEYAYGIDEIREELIQEVHDEQGKLIAAVTRNRYGALVLNAANVMFIDVDLPPSLFHPKGFFASLLSIFKRKESNADIVATARAALRHKFSDFQSNNNDLSLRVYETSAGFRLVVLNKTMDSNGDETQRIFNDLGSDSLYQKLCENQQCFRARITPKPWRVGLKKPPYLFPREDDKHQAEFSAWLKNYDTESQQYGVCSEHETLGNQAIDPTVKQVLSLHDKYVIKPNAKQLA